MIAKSNIGAALFTGTQQRVFGLLFGHPDQSFYLNEVVRLAGMGKGTVKRELERLLESGLITLDRRGNQNHYQANADSPIFNELCAIVRKTLGVADVLRAALQPLAGDIEAAFVYGSIAKGEETAASDIDLMVIADHLSYSALMEALLPAQKHLMRPINPAVYASTEIKTKLRDQNNFLLTVLAGEKIIVLGDTLVVGQLANDL